MSAFPGSPRLLKGALVAFEVGVPLPRVIVFQYNPESMTRRLEARTAAGGDAGERAEPFRLTGAPRETITISVVVDATDQLETGDPVAASSGVAPVLAMLELLLYPKSAVVVANTALMQAGVLEVLPAQAPLLVLVWGPQRVLPVRLGDFSVTEEAFDPALNPILAKLDLTLTVQSYSDLKLTDPGYTLFLAYQIAKERLAAASPTGSLQRLGVPIPQP
jgi:Contractile injection system tube protein